MRQLKRCSRCHVLKGLPEFKPDSRFSTGRRPECRECARPEQRAQAKRYRQSDNGYKNRTATFNRYVNSPAGRKARRESARRVRAKLKLEVLTFYSNGKPTCGCCAETQIAFLTVDHIKGKGRKHRAAISREGRSFYQWLRNKKFPTGYRVLCFNCNFATHVFGVCPHQQQEVYRVA